MEWCKSGIRTPRLSFLRHCLIYYVLIYYVFPRIVGILSYVLCSELIRYFCEIFTATLGAPNATKVSIFGGGGRVPCNLSGVQLARQFMKLNSFV